VGQVIAVSDAQEVARALVEAGAVWESRPGGLVLDVTRLTSHPQLHTLVCERLTAWIKEKAAYEQVVICPNTASLPLATMAASALGLPMAYLRPKPKEHGRRRQVEGVIPAGAWALLLYDELTVDTPEQDAREIVAAHDGIVTEVLGLLGDEEQEKLCLTSHAAVREAMAAGAVPVDPPAVRPRLPVPSTERLAATRERIAEILLAVGAVSINAREPFRYTSGLLSPIYTDNRILISHPREWAEVVDGYASALAQVVARQPVDVLAGAATAGVPHAARLAEATGLPMTFVDLSAESDDKGPGHAYGRLQPGDHAVIVEDLVTTGKSVFETVEAVRARGALADWCVAIFTYNPASIGEILGAEGLGFTALSDIDTLLEVGVRSGKLSEADRAAVLEWRIDPAAWSAAAEARIAG
jgi:orotate phosphoribosyltransferase